MLGRTARAAISSHSIDEPQLHRSGGNVGRTRLLKVWQVDAASRFALLRPRLSTPQAIVREAVREVAKADLRSKFRSQSSEAVGTAPRAHTASNSDHHEGIMSEAIPVVHAGLFALCSLTSRPERLRILHLTSGCGNHKLHDVARSIAQHCTRRAQPRAAFPSARGPGDPNRCGLGCAQS
jgi:hypothetical protein